MINSVKYEEMCSSLVEILVALMITGLLSTGVLFLLSSLAQWVYDARQSSVATWYGATLLASLRDNRQLLDEDLIGKTAIEMDLAGVPTEQGVIATVSKVHRREPDSKLYDVTVEVAWRFGGSDRILQLSTIIRKE
ncbi:MAG: hypothetical protein GYA42_06800 [Syntrophomonadaceae bacterium]|nr:hypothetical protein [Syntrophomonadaceae bacterium]